MSDARPGLIMCVCTGKCPGFEKMDIWDFINRVRIELRNAFGARITAEIDALMRVNS